MWDVRGPVDAHDRLARPQQPDGDYSGPASDVGDPHSAPSRQQCLDRAGGGVGSCVPAPGGVIILRLAVVIEHARTLLDEIAT